MSLNDLLEKGVSAVDAGDERVLAQAILDLNAKVDAAVAKIGTGTGLPATLTIMGGTIDIAGVVDIPGDEKDDGG
jgi:hypothetical protein